MKKLLLLLVAIVISIGSSQSVAACSCVPNGTTFASFNMYDTVFSGEVIKKGTKPGLFINNTTFDFTVDTIYKGKEASTIQIETANNSAACGYNFEVGEEYLVFAGTTDEGITRVSLCSATELLETAEKEISILEELKDKKSEGESCFLQSENTCLPGLECIAKVGSTKGICKKDTEKVCTEVYDPVCGIDGKTYGNECVAGTMIVDYKGECVMYNGLTETENERYMKLSDLIEDKYITVIDKALYTITDKYMSERNIIIKKFTAIQDRLDRKIQELDINEDNVGKSNKTLKEKLENLLYYLNYRMKSLVHDYSR